MITIKLSKRISKNVRDIMNKDLEKYESSQGIDVNYNKFSLVLSSRGDIIGILTAYTAFAEIYLEDLWVHSEHRCKGFGKMLMQELENRFEGKGFNNINLCTSQFQAPEFYLKCGFTLEFTRKNLQNPKFTKFFFVKFFKDPIQHQGVAKSLIRN